jgi:hypothetical protein
VIGPVTAFNNEVVDISLDIPANLRLEYRPVILVKVGPAFFKPSGIRTKQKVPKGVIKMVFSSSSFAIQH